MLSSTQRNAFSVASDVAQNPSPVREVSVCDVTPIPPPHANGNVRCVQASASPQTALLTRRSSQLEGIQYFNVAVEGKGFLYRQVRKMVGALLAVGRGQWSAKEIHAAFEEKEPSACPFVAPPQGLTLASVHYASDEGVTVGIDQRGE